MNSSTTNLKCLMNTKTGSVDTEENWAAEGFTPANAELVEVIKDEDGKWVVGGHIHLVLTY